MDKENIHTLKGIVFHNKWVNSSWADLEDIIVTEEDSTEIKKLHGFTHKKDQEMGQKRIVG